MTQADKRERDRRHDAKRRAGRPWRSLYATKEWRVIRARQLRAEPWCRMCAAQSKRIAATIVDHVERHGGDAVRFFAGPFQSLCEHHHNSVKQALERGDREPCGLDGLPTSPGHPWGGG